MFNSHNLCNNKTLVYSIHCYCYPIISTANVRVMEKGEYTTIATNLHLQLSQVSDQTKTGTLSPDELVIASTDPLSPIHNVRAGVSRSLDQSCTFKDKKNMLLAYVLIKKHIKLLTVILLSVLLHKSLLLLLFKFSEECSEAFFRWKGSSDWVNWSIVLSWVARSSTGTRSSNDIRIPWQIGRCALPSLPTQKYPRKYKCVSEVLPMLMVYHLNNRTIYALPYVPQNRQKWYHNTIGLKLDTSTGQQSVKVQQATYRNSQNMNMGEE